MSTFHSMTIPPSPTPQPRNVTCQGLQTLPPHVEKILEPQTPGLETCKSSPLILPWKTDPEVTLQRNRFGEDVPRPEDL